MNYFNKLKEYWHIVCSSSDLKDQPKSFEILETPIVLFRSNKQVSALIDSCPHRNTPLSAGKVINGNIECPYHGWQFNKDGDCTKIPGLCNFKTSSKMNAQKIEVSEKHGFIWVKLTSSKNKIFSKPFDNNKFFSNFIWKATSDGNLINILENFLDATHTHFVHKGLIRTEGNRQKLQANISKIKDFVEIEYVGESKQAGLISKIFENNRKTSFGRFTFPSIAEIEYQSNKGAELIITAFFTPINKEQCMIFANIKIRKSFIPSIIKRLIISPFFKKALKQDLEILKLQQENIRKFGKENFNSVKLDLIRPNIKSMFKGNNKNIKKTIDISL